MNILQSIAQESAISFLERNTRRPTLRSLDLFPNGGLASSDVVEIAGEDCKTLVLTHLVCQAMAPRNVDGCQAGVLLLDLDQKKMKTQDLVDCVSARLEAVLGVDVGGLDKRALVKGSLRRLHIVRAYDAEGLRTFLSEGLAPFLARQPDVALVAVDGLGAHFHAERKSGAVKDATSYDAYAREQLKRLRKALAVFNVGVVYTKAAVYSADSKYTKRSQAVTKRVVVVEGSEEEDPTTRLLRVTSGRSSTTAEVLLSIKDYSHVRFDRL